MQRVKYTSFSQFSVEQYENGVPWRFDATTPLVNKDSWLLMLNEDKHRKNLIQIRRACVLYGRLALVIFCVILQNTKR